MIMKYLEVLEAFLEIVEKFLLVYELIPSAFCVCRDQWGMAKFFGCILFLQQRSIKNTFQHIIKKRLCSPFITHNLTGIGSIIKTQIHVFQYDNSKRGFKM